MITAVAVIYALVLGLVGGARTLGMAFAAGDLAAICLPGDSAGTAGDDGRPERPTHDATCAILHCAPGTAGPAADGVLPHPPAPVRTPKLAFMAQDGVASGTVSASFPRGPPSIG